MAAATAVDIRNTPLFGRSEAVCLVDLDRRIVQYSPEMARFALAQDEPLAGRSCCQLIHGHAQCVPSCPLSAMMESGKSSVAMVPSGDRWMTASAVPMRDDSGKICGAIHSFSDSVPPTQVMNALARVQRCESIAHVSAGVAHDLNNVFYIIKASVALMKSASTESSSTQDMMTNVEEAAHKGDLLCKQLLMFAAGEYAEKCAISPAELIREAANFALIGSRRQVFFTFDKGLAAIETNPSEMRQLIANLVINARDASEEGSSIMIQAGNMSKEESVSRGLSPQKYVRISIHDTGSGVSEHHLQRIFDPFFTTKRYGSGLGLPVSRMIVENHGGFIHVESDGHSGTVVTVYLPAFELEARQQVSATFRTALENGTFCLDLKSNTKRGIIEEMVNAMAENGHLADPGAAFAAVLGRERSMSTGMQNGIAIPHGKTRTVNNLVVAFGLKRNGIDFDAIDGKPSKIFVMTISSPDTAGDHVRYLAELSRLLESSDRAENLLKASSAADVVRILTS